MKYTAFCFIVCMWCVCVCWTCAYKSVEVRGWRWGSSSSAVHWMYWGEFLTGIQGLLASQLAPGIPRDCVLNPWDYRLPHSLGVSVGDEELQSQVNWAIALAPRLLFLRIYLSWKLNACQFSNLNIFSLSVFLSLQPKLALSSFLPLRFNEDTKLKVKISIIYQYQGQLILHHNPSVNILLRNISSQEPQADEGELSPNLGKLFSQ